MGNPFRKVIGFITTSGSSRTISIIVILIIAAAIPLTVIVSQKQQETRQRAAVYHNDCTAYGCNGPSLTVTWPRNNAYGGFASNYYVWLIDPNLSGASSLVAATPATGDVTSWTFAPSCGGNTHCTQFNVWGNYTYTVKVYLTVAPCCNNAPWYTTSVTTGACVGGFCQGGPTATPTFTPTPTSAGTACCPQDCGGGPCSLSCNGQCYSIGACTDPNELGCTGWTCGPNGPVCPPKITPTTPPTPTVNPTLTPSVTPTGVPGDTQLQLSLGLDGLGATGDNTNPGASSGSNKNPRHPTRNATVEILSGVGNALATQSGTVKYDGQTGLYVETIDMGAGISSGNYIVKVKSDGYLRRQIPGIQSIKGGQLNTLPQIRLVAGDINGDNMINIADYNILISCSTFSPDNQALCNQNTKYQQLSDLDDDGVVDQNDYNLFLIEFSVQNGD